MMMETLWDRFIKMMMEEEEEDNNQAFFTASVGIFVVITSLLFWVLNKVHKLWIRRKELDQWIQLTLQERESKVHYVLNLPNNNTNDNKKLWSATETRDLILSGKLNAQENIAFLAKRCRQYGCSSSNDSRDRNSDSGVNAVTEEFYDDAYETATTLMKQLINNIETKEEIPPPLYGVPIVIKDCIGLKGSLSTGGLACRLNQRDQEDSLIIKILKTAGAIPLCKGNVVQGMGLSDGVNRIYGMYKCTNIKHKSM